MDQIHQIKVDNTSNYLWAEWSDLFSEIKLDGCRQTISFVDLATGFRHLISSHALKHPWSDLYFILIESLAFDPPDPARFILAEGLDHMTDLNERWKSETRSTAMVC